jgi:hypothetical protein
LTAGSLAAVEWEAFLSLDGGRTYPVRITPHLDLSIRRRFHFQVPAFPTRDGLAVPVGASEPLATPLPGRLETGSAVLPPVRPSVRVLTGRLNE